MFSDMLYGANARSNAHSVLMPLVILENKGEYCEKKKRIKKQNVQSEYVKEKRRKKKEEKKSVPAVNIVKK